MKTHLLIPFCVIAACASVSGTQTFEATRIFTLPSVPAAATGVAGTQTITALGTANQLSFADSVLDDVDDLRERDHVDSAQASVRVVSIRLTANTTFAGVSAIRVQLVTAAETIELCARTLSADEQKSSTLNCEADHVMDEETLKNSTAAMPAQIGAQLDVSSGITATRLSSVVSFEVQVDADVSL